MFKATLLLLGVNPYVPVPEEILREVFIQAGKEKSPIPIQGTVNGVFYRQTLVMYQGAWRLYINTKMLKNSPKRIGEILDITVQYDPESRTIVPPARFIEALAAQPEAQRVFEEMPASRKLEIARYLTNLKTEESRNKNIARAIRFLLGQERFIGRDKP